MYIDYKKTAWERVYIPEECNLSKDDIIALIKKHEPSNNGLWDDLPIEPTAENLDDTDIFLTVKENEGYSTIELYDDEHTLLWDNTQPRFFEAVLKGYNGATDETDHLIKWIQAPSLNAAEKAIEQQGWETDSPILEMTDIPDTDAIDLIVNSESGIIKNNPVKHCGLCLQLIDTEGENYGLYTTEREDLNRIEIDIQATFDEGIEEVDEHLEKLNIHRVFAEPIYVKQ